jgi:hypothetical protein
VEAPNTQGGSNPLELLGRQPRRAFARKILKFKTKSPLNKKCSKIFSFNDVSPRAAMQEEMG